MSFFAAIRDIINPPQPTLSELATGLCALPMPRKRYEAPKQEAAPDMYVIDEVRSEFGFHSATAKRQSTGGVSDLTGYDVTLLKERDLWGKNKKLNGENATAKKCWHGGKTEKEAGAILNKSESWIEKRYGTFSTALLQEIDENE